MFNAIYSCDFETDNLTSEVKIATFLKIEHNKILLDIDKNVDNVSLTYSFDDMLDMIILHNTKRKHKKQKKILLYFTNSSKFDGYFVRTLCLKNGYTQVLDKKLNEGEFNILEPEQQGIMCLSFVYRNFYFEVRDFKLLVTLSVKEKGTVVGIEKGSYKGKNYDWLNDDGEINWKKLFWDKLTKDEWNAMEYYAKKDALIDGLYIINHFKVIGKPKKLTKSGNAFLMAHKTVEEKNKTTTKKMRLKILNDEVWDQHYQGGMNYINKNWLFVPKLYVNEFDEINMYVSKMAVPLPLDGGSDIPIKNGTKLLRINLINFKMKKKYINSVGQGFIPAKRGKDLNCEFDFTTNSYAISGKNHIVEVWEKEFKIWQKIYDISYEPLETKYFALGDHLRDKMLELYNDREYYKSLMKKENYAVNYVLQNDKKTEGNSVYGILGENPIKRQYYYCKDELEKGTIISGKDGKRSIVVVGKSHKKFHDYTKYITQTYEKPLTRKNIYIASYVTMLGRCDMYDFILTGLVGRVDTDGFTADKQLIFPQDKLKNYLGFFKLETDKMKKWFMLLGYKCYVYSDDGKFYNENLKFKGIRELLQKDDKGNIIPLDGTNISNINWYRAVGISTSGIETENGKSILDVEKKLLKQQKYLQIIKENSWH